VSIQSGFAQDPDELFDVVNADGSPTGIVKRRADVHRDGDWHRAIHVWVWGVDERGPYILLNLRGRHKDTWPGALDVTVGGHLAAGETTDQAFREIEEEIGVVAERAQLHFLERRQAVGQVEREIQDVFLYRDDRDLEEFVPNPAELEGLVELYLERALAVFGGTAKTAGARVLDASDRSIQPFVVSEENLLPERYHAYYLRVAQAIALGAVNSGSHVD
jgi:isopentenyldiphosphate isomerase